MLLVPFLLRELSLIGPPDILVPHLPQRGPQRGILRRNRLSYTNNKVTIQPPQGYICNDDRAPTTHLELNDPKDFILQQMAATQM